MPEKISILKESGETLSSNIVSVFLIPDTEKKYIITTENAVDPHGLTVLHVSEFADGALKKVATDEEWSSIKTIMRAIISGNVGSYKYLPKIENATAEGQYSRDISVSASASKQMIENYNAADTTEEAAPEPAPEEAAPEAPVEGSNIFPEGEENKNEENEVMPGIEEVPEGGEAHADEAPAPEAVPEEAAPETTPVPVEVPPAPEVAVPQDLNNEVQVPNLGVQQPVVPVAVPQVDPNAQPGVAPGAISVLPIEPNLNPGVQTAIPAQTIPTSQIVQGPPEMGMPVQEMPFDMNAVPSFNPNATIDEVVMGAQEMFMAGVKNLVQTIQEKVYRDLYTKEAELKERERIIENKEAMLNSQFATMMNNFTANFNGVPVQQPMFPQPNMVTMGTPNMNLMNTMTGMAPITQMSGMTTPMVGAVGMMPQVPQVPGAMPNNINNPQG